MRRFASIRGFHPDPKHRRSVVSKGNADTMTPEVSPRTDSGRRGFLKLLLALPFGLPLFKRFYGGKDAGSQYLLNVFSVAGYAYYDGERVEETLKRGETLVLRAEPENSYDGFAVEILRADGAKLGYVPRRDNKAIHRLLRQGAKVVGRVEEIRPQEPTWKRVKVSLWLVV